MSLVLGWFGQGLPRPPLLMPISLLEAPSLSGALLRVVVLQGLEWLGWEGGEGEEEQSAKGT